MTISQTLRNVTEDIFINADGIQCDRNGVPISLSGGAGIMIATAPPVGTPTVSTILWDKTNNGLWVSEAGVGWTQLIQL